MAPNASAATATPVTLKICVHDIAMRTKWDSWLGATPRFAAAVVSWDGKVLGKPLEIPFQSDQAKPRSNKISNDNEILQKQGQMVHLSLKPTHIDGKGSLHIFYFRPKTLTSSGGVYCKGVLSLAETRYDVGPAENHVLLKNTEGFSVGHVKVSAHYFIDDPPLMLDLSRMSKAERINEERKEQLRKEHKILSVHPPPGMHELVPGYDGVGKSVTHQALRPPIGLLKTHKDYKPKSSLTTKGLNTEYAAKQANASKRIAHFVRVEGPVADHGTAVETAHEKSERLKAHRAGSLQKKTTESHSFADTLLPIIERSEEMTVLLGQPCHALGPTITLPSKEEVTTWAKNLTHDCEASELAVQPGSTIAPRRARTKSEAAPGKPSTAAAGKEAQQPGASSLPGSAFVDAVSTVCGQGALQDDAGGVPQPGNADIRRGRISVVTVVRVPCSPDAVKPSFKVKVHHGHSKVKMSFERVRDNWMGKCVIPWKVLTDDVIVKVSEKSRREEDTGETYNIVFRGLVHSATHGSVEVNGKSYVIDASIRYNQEARQRLQNVMFFSLLMCLPNKNSEALAFYYEVGATRRCISETFLNIARLHKELHRYLEQLAVLASQHSESYHHMDSAGKYFKRFSSLLNPIKRDYQHLRSQKTHTLRMPTWFEGVDLLRQDMQIIRRVIKVYVQFVWHQKILHREARDTDAPDLQSAAALYMDTLEVAENKDSAYLSQKRRRFNTEIEQVLAGALAKNVSETWQCSKELVEMIDAESETVSSPLVGQDHESAVHTETGAVAVDCVEPSSPQHTFEAVTEKLGVFITGIVSYTAEIHGIFNDALASYTHVDNVIAQVVWAFIEPLMTNWGSLLKSTHHHDTLSSSEAAQLNKLYYMLCALESRFGGTGGLRVLAHFSPLLRYNVKQMQVQIAELADRAIQEDTQEAMSITTHQCHSSVAVDFETLIFHSIEHLHDWSFANAAQKRMVMKMTTEVIMAQFETFAQVMMKQVEQLIKSQPHLKSDGTDACNERIRKVAVVLSNLRHVVEILGHMSDYGLDHMEDPLHPQADQKIQSDITANAHTIAVADQDAGTSTSVKQQISFTTSRCSELLTISTLHFLTRYLKPLVRECVEDALQKELHRGHDIVVVSLTEVNVELMHAVVEGMCVSVTESMYDTAVEYLIRILPKDMFKVVASVCAMECLTAAVIMVYKHFAAMFPDHVDVIDLNALDDETTTANIIWAKLFPDGWRHDSPNAQDGNTNTTNDMNLSVPRRLSCAILDELEDLSPDLNRHCHDNAAPFEDTLIQLNRYHGLVA